MKKQKLVNDTVLLQKWYAYDNKKEFLFVSNKRVERREEELDPYFKLSVVESSLGCVTVCAFYSPSVPTKEDTGRRFITSDYSKVRIGLFSLKS